MNSLFGDILLSAPNQLGGVYACMDDGRVMTLDERSTCGMHFSACGKLVRAIQTEDTLSIISSTGVAHEYPGDWVDLHDVRCVDDDIYLVSTYHNAVIRWNIPAAREVERWTFSEPEDSWHINCLGCIRDELCFTAFGMFPSTRGYKEGTAGQGFLRGLRQNSPLPLLAGLSQPHSIAEIDAQTWCFCNSETSEIWLGGLHDAPQPQIALNGYVRGLAVRDGLLYAGLSASRNMASNPTEGSAQLVAIDLDNWQEVGRIALPFMEIYDILAFSDKVLFMNLVTNILSASLTRMRQQHNMVLDKLSIALNQNVKLKIYAGLPGTVEI